MRREISYVYLIIKKCLKIVLLINRVLLNIIFKIILLMLLNIILLLNVNVQYWILKSTQEKHDKSIFVNVLNSMSVGDWKVVYNV